MPRMKITGIWFFFFIGFNLIHHNHFQSISRRIFRWKHNTFENASITENTIIGHQHFIISIEALEHFTAMSMIRDFSRISPILLRSALPTNSFNVLMSRSTFLIALAVDNVNIASRSKQSLCIVININSSSAELVHIYHPKIHLTRVNNIFPYVVLQIL